MSWAEKKDSKLCWLLLEVVSAFILFFKESRNIIFNVFVRGYFEFFTRNSKKARVWNKPILSSCRWTPFCLLSEFIHGVRHLPAWLVKSLLHGLPHPFPWQLSGVVVPIPLSLERLSKLCVDHAGASRTWFLGSLVWQYIFPCLRVAIVVIRHHGQKQLGKERVCFPCMSTSLIITEGGQGQNSTKVGTWRQTWWRDSGWVLLFLLDPYNLCSLLLSYKT